MRSLFIGLLVLVSSIASAERGRGRVQQPTYYPQAQSQIHTQASGGTTAARAPKERAYREQDSIGNMEFSYKYAIANPEVDKVKMQIHVTDSNLLKDKDQLFAEVEVTNLRHDRKTDKVSVPITWDDKGNAFIEVANLKPQSTFKMKVHFNKLNEDGKTGKRISSTGDYYSATSGDSLAAKARFKVVTAGLLEVDDWRARRKGHHNFPYQNVSGGWCGTFQQYCAEPYLKVYGEAPTYPVQKQGWEIPSIATKDEPVHGNHGYVSSHKLMVLEYSADSGQVYTIEGNWANSVGINRRSPSEIGTLGVITDNFAWKENVDTTSKK